MNAECLFEKRVPNLQLSDKERELEYSNLFKDVASILVDKCINPETQKPYTISMMERALRDVHFSVDPKKSSKQQALEVRLYLLGDVQRLRLADFRVLICTCSCVSESPNIIFRAGPLSATRKIPHRACSNATASHRTC